jgi:hypothetical protein
VQNPKFDNFILIVIIISSLKLVIDTYTDLGTVSEALDLSFNIIFALEAAFKIVAYGFLIDENSYLTDSWSKIDFFIVCASLIDLSFQNINLPAIKVLRLLRTLRPLRFISHNVNMKIVVTALLESIGALFNVLIVIFFVW